MCSNQKHTELTCFRKVTQGATERAPALAPPPWGVRVIQTSAAHGAVPALFL